ncbi:MAG: MBL fold metallo-hydrolase, partial [Cetobacterium sp.]
MYFYGLSGTNKIGGSSYFLKLGEKKFLLDAGIDPNEPGTYPKYENLYRKKLLTTMGDLDGIIISHAHLDHIGSLPYMLKEGGNVDIIASKETKTLGKAILLSAPKE